VQAVWASNVTYDQWKTRSPDDDAPVCDHCGDYLHYGTCFALYCPGCEAEEIEAHEQVLFYEWEPESPAEGVPAVLSS
jgi:hypothetical protein